ncbi:MAG: hypothetical protein ABIT96_08690 [Ferruginibacter sp.]
MKKLFILATAACLVTGASFADASGGKEKEKKKKCEKSQQKCSKKMQKTCCKGTTANL